MSMGRRPTRTWAEHDLTTGWRRVVCYMQRAGVAGKIKRGARRRERREARQDIRHALARGETD